MGSYMVPPVSIMICSITILVITYFYMYHIERKIFFKIWFFSWLVNLFGQIITLIIVSGVNNNSLYLGGNVLFFISTYLLVKGSFTYLKRKIPRWYSIVIGISIMWMIFAIFKNIHGIPANLPLSLVLGTSTAWVGLIFLRYGEGQTNLRRVFGGCFILWGIHKMDYVVLRDSWFAPWGYIISASFSLVITITFIFIYFEKIRTELIESRNVLVANEKKLFNIIENQNDIIFELNSEGKFTFISPSCYNLIGFKPGEVEAIGFIDFIGEENWKQIKTSKLEGCYFEKLWRNKEGIEVYLKIYCKPSFNTEHQLESIFGSISNITEHKLLNEAKEYDRLRTEFFANLSHELRTPLNVILASSQLLQLYSKNNDLSDHREKIDKNNATIKQNVYRLSKLIGNLIDITKVDTGFFELQNGNYNIINVVEEITLSVVDYIESKGLSLEFDTDLEERIISCDADKIERIMLNLLSNSAKFTNEGGRISVKITNDENNIYISVTDTGIGIQKDKLDMIFERFRQVDKSLTRNHEGSGIGLSLVKSLVELHGGSIKVDSTFGKGSEFIITLPAAEADESGVINTYENCCVKKNEVEFSDICL